MPHKLLLADDSVTIQRVIELTFADEDVQVIAVGNGQDAIDRVQRDRPDIVLADVGMPERNGYEVAAFIKGNPATAHIPVVLLTGAFEPVDEGRARVGRLRRRPGQAVRAADRHQPREGSAGRQAAGRACGARRRWRRARSGRRRRGSRQRRGHGGRAGRRRSARGVFRSTGRGVRLDVHVGRGADPFAGFAPSLASAPQPDPAQPNAKHSAAEAACARGVERSVMRTGIPIWWAIRRARRRSSRPHRGRCRSRPCLRHRAVPPPVAPRQPPVVQPASAPRRRAVRAARRAAAAAPLSSRRRSWTLRRVARGGTAASGLVAVRGDAPAPAPAAAPRRPRRSADEMIDDRHRPRPGAAERTSRVPRSSTSPSGSCAKRSSESSRAGYR